MQKTLCNFSELKYKGWTVMKKLLAFTMALMLLAAANTGSNYEDLAPGISLISEGYGIAFRKAPISQQRSMISWTSR